MVERARETFEAEQAERMAKRFAKGLFNMNDLKMQLEQMLKMGGMQSIMGMLPGMGGVAKAAEKAGFDDRMLKRQIALIQSMTKKERANPDMLQASRKRCRTNHADFCVMPISFDSCRLLMPLRAVTSRYMA